MAVVLFLMFVSIFAWAENDSLQSLRTAEATLRDCGPIVAKHTMELDGRVMVGRHPALLTQLEFARKYAPVNGTVLIIGESGTGKEFFAQFIHDHSPRKDHPFVRANCAGFTESLAESELFGHVKGAYTGADRDREGLFERADGGTLFLDEVAELSPALQSKLLRILQEGTGFRVGGEKEYKVDVRVVVATNKNLYVEMQEGRFEAISGFPKQAIYRLPTIG